MLALLGISTIASLVASSVLGVRLLLLYRRSRQLPELIIGSAFLVAGVVGYVLTLVGAGGAQQMPPTVARNLFVLGQALISLGVILNYLFVWRVFRAGSMLARVWIGIACPVVAVTAIPMGLPEPGAASSGLAPGVFVFWLGHAVRIAAGGWGAVEAGRYWLTMRRRMRLGLADPVVTNRIGLWGLACLGGVFVFGSTALANSTGSSMGDILTPGRIAFISSVTLSVALFQWLAFLPPGRYLRWVAARAPQAA